MPKDELPPDKPAWIDLVAEAADDAERKQEQSQIDFQEQQRRLANGLQYKRAWQEWRDAHATIEQQRNKGATCYVDETELIATVLNDLATGIRELDLIDNLRIANDRFDPKAYDGREDEAGAKAIKITLCLLCDLFDGKGSDDIARTYLSNGKLAPMWGADVARHVIRTAEHIPICCPGCGKLNELPSFDRGYCCGPCRKENEVVELAPQKLEPLPPYSMSRVCRGSVMSTGTTGTDDEQNEIRSLNAKLKKAAVDLGLCDWSIQGWNGGLRDIGKRLVQFWGATFDESHDDVMGWELAAACRHLR